MNAMMTLDQTNMGHTSVNIPSHQRDIAFFLSVETHDATNTIKKKMNYSKRTKDTKQINKTNFIHRIESIIVLGKSILCTNRCQDSIFIHSPKTIHQQDHKNVPEHK